MTNPGSQEKAAQIKSDNCSANNDASDNNSSNNHASDHRSMNKDPLHGITLKMMLEELQQSLGWEGLREKVNVNCFKSNPSIKSSLTFLRRTPWAREKIERLYLKSKGHKPARKEGIKLSGTTNKSSRSTWASDSKPSDDKKDVTNPWLNIKR